MQNIQPDNRISEIDLLRGFALLGIFLMNIVAMAYPFEAYFNPNVFEVKTWYLPEDHKLSVGLTLNEVLFSVSHVLVDQKMMGLFSLLFGVSTMLLLNNLREKQKGLKFYFIRNIWLIVLGLLHGILLFIGDILLIYGLCAIVLVLFARLSAGWKFWLGVSIYCIPIVMQVLMQLSLKDFSAEQLLMLDEVWNSRPEWIIDDIQFFRTASYQDIVWFNLQADSIDEANAILEWYWISIYIEGFSRSFGLMLIGMASYRWGVMSGFCRTKFAANADAIYSKMVAIGFGLGLLIACLGLTLNFYHAWSSLYSAIGGRVLNHVATPLMVCGYVALLMKASRHEWFKFSIMGQGLQAVGRMALSNYIMQSLIGLLVFTGVGFGLYAQLNRLELLGVVLLVWGFQLCVSSLWLSRFRYGPLEWLWRCLTYMKWVKI